MIGKYKVVEVGQPLDLRKEADQHEFIQRTIQKVNDVLQEQVDEYLPNKSLVHTMLNSVYEAIADINHIEPSKVQKPEPSIAGTWYLP